MKFREFIDRLVSEQLGGDTEGFARLFEGGALFGEMTKLDGDGEHYFREETYDGWYLIRTPEGYLVYSQERGGKWVVGTFATLGEAMLEFGYVRSVMYRPEEHVIYPEAQVADDTPPGAPLRWKPWLACALVVAILWMFPAPFALMVGEPPGIIQFAAILIGAIALLWLQIVLFIGEVRDVIARYKRWRATGDSR